MAVKKLLVVLAAVELACGGVELQGADLMPAPAAVSPQQYRPEELCPGADKVAIHGECRGESEQDGGTVTMQIDWNDCTPNVFLECTCAAPLTGDLLMRLDHLADLEYRTASLMMWRTIACR